VKASDAVGETAAFARGADAALHPRDAADDADVQRQMARLYELDRRMAAAFVVALLVTLPFVVIAVWNVISDAKARVVLVAAAGVLATYNVASMTKLVANYRRDRDFIYRRDVLHLRELRAARRARKGAAL
jgi:hypothetical protein